MIGQPFLALLALSAMTGGVAACSSEPTRGGPDASALSGPPVTLPADPPRCAAAPEGTILSRRMTSTVTKGTERLRIYLPPGFERTRPGTAGLLILLHGASADETQWIDVGIASGADCLIAAGEIGPMAIVAVDGTRVETDSGASPPAMERFITNEVLPYMRTNYPMLAGPMKTSIGGISRGGGWALRIAADRPDLFRAVGGHSPATNLSAEDERLLATHNVRVWLDVGKQDALRSRVQALASSLRSRGGGAQFMTWSGGHDRRYWSHHVEDYLRFYARTW